MCLGIWIYVVLLETNHTGIGKNDCGKRVITYKLKIAQCATGKFINAKYPLVKIADKAGIQR